MGFQVICRADRIAVISRYVEVKSTVITDKERSKAFVCSKKLEVSERQKLNVCHHLEDHDVNDRPRRFLDAFAAILKHSNYRMVLEHFTRMTARCSRCSAQCQIYRATGDSKDIPCYRSGLLLDVYCWHFTLGGLLKGRISGRDYLTDEKIGCNISDLGGQNRAHFNRDFSTS